MTTCPSGFVSDVIFHIVERNQSDDVIIHLVEFARWKHQSAAALRARGRSLLS